MSLSPPTSGGGGPVGSSFLPLMFLGFVAMGVGAILLVFAPGWLIVFGVLFASVVSQYFIWGRWLRSAIEAEEAAEAELGAGKAENVDPRLANHRDTEAQRAAQRNGGGGE